MADNSDTADDHSPWEPASKKIEDDLLSLALRGTTNNEKFLAMDITYMINRQSGGAVISPWEIAYLSEDWINSFIALTRSLPNMKAGMRKIEKKKDEIVSKHPTYKPLPKRH